MTAPETLFGPKILLEGPSGTGKTYAIGTLTDWAAARGIPVRVLFIENTGVRQLRLSDLGRVRSRLRNWQRGTKGFREERPNLFTNSVANIGPHETVIVQIEYQETVSKARALIQAAEEALQNQD